MLNEILVSLGLSAEESDIYLSLLEKGPQGASSLARTTKVKRTYVYRIASELIKKGLATLKKQGKTTVYEPQSPDHLLTQAESQKQAALEAQTALEGILGSLKAKYKSVEAKPVITYYEGVEGIKKVYLDTIAEEKPILALVETSKVDPEIYEWVTHDYVRLRVEHLIPVRAIVASGPKTQAYLGLNEAELRESKKVSSDKFPFEHEINVYGEKVAIINHRQGSTLLGIIIDNPLIAKTFRSWFELTWQLIQ